MRAVARWFLWREMRALGRASLALSLALTPLLAGISAAEPRSPLILIDKRPADELKEKSSSLITSCYYFVVRLDDRDINGSRIDILSEDLNNNLLEELSGKEISVNHYTIVFNGHKNLRGGIYSYRPNSGQSDKIDRGGFVPNVMFDMGDNCSREKNPMGWYEESETTSPYSPYIGEVEVDIGGKIYSARTVYSPDRQLFAGGRKKKDQGAAQIEAIKATNNALIAKIRTDFPKE